MLPGGFRCCWVALDVAGWFKRCCQVVFDVAGWF